MSSSSSSKSSGDVRQFLESEIQNHKVVVFSKSYCPYCTTTKTLLSAEVNDGLVVHELDRMKNGTAIQNELAALTGQRTVPNVFIKGQHLGGNDDTQAAKRSGQLAKMLS